MNMNYEVPLPSPAQLAYHEEELAAFIHFGMNTIYEREWGDGTEDPARFDPAHLDADKWILTLKEAGFKRVILVVKHHDGFVLYPSKYTDYTIAKSPWKDGKGDLLLEVSRAVTKYDMGLGIYLSPWDRHDERYSVARQDEYNEYYLNQLKEILENPSYGNNGKFVEIWMDGARGEGEQEVIYSFDKWFAYIQSRLGVDVNIFSEDPTSVRWIGNESGRAGDPLWQRVKKSKMAVLKNGDPEYLNHGDRYGDMYSVGEADVSIRSGWFFLEEQHLKKVPELMAIYFASVGRGAPLLLNVPPMKDGQFAETDVTVLRAFRQELDRIQATRINTAKTIHINEKELEIHYAELVTADLVELKEQIASGQRVGAFSVSIWIENGWQLLTEGQTIGAKRLLQTKYFQTDKIKLTILDAIGTWKIADINLYDSGFSQTETLAVSGKVEVERGEKAVIELSKKGNQTTLVTISTHPDSAVHGRHYVDTNQVVAITADRQTVEIETLAFLEPKKPVRFFVKIAPEGEDTVVSGTETIEVVIN